MMKEKKYTKVYLGKSVTFFDGAVCHCNAAHGASVFVVAWVKDEGF